MPRQGAGASLGTQALPLSLSRAIPGSGRAGNVRLSGTIEDTLATAERRSGNGSGLLCHGPRSTWISLDDPATLAARRRRRAGRISGVDRGEAVLVALSSLAPGVTRHRAGRRQGPSGLLNSPCGRQTGASTRLLSRRRRSLLGRPRPRDESAPARRRGLTTRSAGARETRCRTGRTGSSRPGRSQARAAGWS